MDTTQLHGRWKSAHLPLRLAFKLTLHRSTKTPLCTSKNLNRNLSIRLFNKKRLMVTLICLCGRRNQALIRALSTPLPDSEDLYFPSKYPQTFWQQCMACLWKQYRSYWCNPFYNAVRFFFTACLGLMLGTIFWRQGRKT